MKDERMKVLEMLEKQVITAEEAQRLLELLTKPIKGERAREAASCFTEDFSDKAEMFGEKVEALAKDFAQKLEAVAKDVEPKLKKATQIIIEKTVATVDEVSKAFHEETTKCDDKTDCHCDCSEKKENDDEPKEN